MREKKEKWHRATRFLTHVLSNLKELHAWVTSVKILRSAWTGIFKNPIKDRLGFRGRKRGGVDKGARMRVDVLLLAFTYLNFYWKSKRFVEGYIERFIPKCRSKVSSISVLTMQRAVIRLVWCISYLNKYFHGNKKQTNWKFVKHQLRKDKMRYGKANSNHLRFGVRQVE